MRGFTFACCHKNVISSSFFFTGGLRADIALESITLKCPAEGHDERYGDVTTGIGSERVSGADMCPALENSLRETLIPNLREL